MANKDSSRAVVRVGVDAAERMQRLMRKKDESSIEYAYRTLEYNIMMLKIPPAAFIREAEIAQRLNMSKTPVHQAINLLRDQTLVDVKARSATHVSRVDLNALDQGFFLRATVEPAVIYHLMETGTPKELSRLQTNLDAQRTLLANQADPYGYIGLDDAFHRIIYQMAGKDLVWSSIKKVTAHFDRVRYMGLVFGYEAPNDNEHHDIFEILTGKTKTTEEQIRWTVSHHLSHYLSFFEQMKTDHPDFFVSSNS
ncbi:transcriptional regulator, GntR family [Coriobacterium glomerans PW2]|uniref:Transcriptional regulator, GntR family n=1 Tax=Coriobacterium glomerans (strain ATCC 49209 / DSM 20642 / JCM 10262 / PW2) TaxID=700015 RepID=F2NBD5_CORGP|nr:GntR family transcriptional regulator [Coriobacterium glomerans]AEB06671.1 transcriptional regulator, GntR family [Coriobacterium glomerans PW2]